MTEVKDVNGGLVNETSGITDSFEPGSDVNTPPSYLKEGCFEIGIDDAIESIGMGEFQRRVLFTAGLCFTADATEIMLLSFLSLTLQSEWGLTANQTANITSCVFAGSLVGTLVLGWLGDHYGRRPAFLISSFIIAIFGLLTAFATGYRSLLVIRFMVGFGVGGLTVPFDIFAEFLPTAQRGKNLLSIQYFWTVGSFMTPIFAYLTLEKSWRLFIILCAVPCIISGVLGICLVPESPRWLISVGQKDKALSIIRDAAATNGLDPFELFPDKITLKEEEVEKSSFRDLLSSRWRKITLLLWGTWMAYAIGYYGTILAITRVFDPDANDDEMQGGAPHFDYKAIFISATAEILSLFLVMQTIDRVGRSLSQVIAYLGGGFFLFSLCMSASTANKTVLTTLAFLARMFEMMGSCVTWVATAEILTTEIRTTGHSAANAMGRTGAFFSPYIVGTNNPIKAVGAVIFVIQIFAACFAYNLPETNGHTLGQSSDTRTDDRNEEDDGTPFQNRALEIDKGSPRGSPGGSVSSTGFV